MMTGLEWIVIITAVVTVIVFILAIDNCCKYFKLKKELEDDLKQVQEQLEYLENRIDEIWLKTDDLERSVNDDD